MEKFKKGDKIRVIVKKNRLGGKSCLGMTGLVKNVIPDRIDTDIRCGYKFYPEELELVSEELNHTPLRTDESYFTPSSIQTSVDYSACLRVVRKRKHKTRIL